MTRWVLAISAVLLVVGGVVVTRTVESLRSAEGQGLVAQLLKRAEAVHAARSADFLEQQAASWARRFHQGQLPCARWQPPTVSAQQLAADVAFKGVTEDAVEFSQWLRWRFAREELERHGAATDAERLAPALEALDGLEGALLREHPQQALAVLRASGGVLGAHLVRVEEEPEAGPLPPAEAPRRKLEALVEKHFTLAGDWSAAELVLREQLTGERFEELATLLTEAAAEGETLVPARRLMDTHRTRLRRLDVDGFEMPITVSRDGEFLVVRSSPQRALRFLAPVQGKMRR
jgi:hypothetical protein